MLSHELQRIIINMKRSNLVDALKQEGFDLADEHNAFHIFMFNSYLEELEKNYRRCLSQELYVGFTGLFAKHEANWCSVLEDILKSMQVKDEKGYVNGFTEYVEEI